MSGPKGVTVTMPTVFECFPNAIVAGVWHIGQTQRGGIVGNSFTDAGAIDVIIDEENSSTVDASPDAQSLLNTTLMYVRPEQMPTANTRALVASYGLYNNQEDEHYDIVDAAVGKNQETGVVEHIELKVVQTEVANVG